MSFLELDAIFLALALAVFAVAVLRSRHKAQVLAAVAVTLAVLLVLTAVFDNIMIGAGLFDYGARALAGPRLGLAPLEDFAYPAAAAVLLPGLWLLLPGRGRK